MGREKPGHPTGGCDDPGHLADSLGNGDGPALRSIRPRARQVGRQTPPCPALPSFLITDLHSLSNSRGRLVFVSFRFVRDGGEGEDGSGVVVDTLDMKRHPPCVHT